MSPKKGVQSDSQRVDEEDGKRFNQTTPHLVSESHDKRVFGPHALVPNINKDDLF